MGAWGYGVLEKDTVLDWGSGPFRNTGFKFNY